VQVWNRHAEDLWGVRHDEAVDHHFLALDIGLPTEQLIPALRGALGVGGSRARLELDAVNRRGRSITCVTTVMPLVSRSSDDGHGARGAIVLMQDAASDGAEGGG
jgi:two-component system CheB/CheR fusion protein